MDAMIIDGHKPVVDDAKDSTADKGKKVSFAEDVKPPAPNGSHDTQEQRGVAQEKGTTNSVAEDRVDGVIGQLEVHQSGIVKMRLNNGMLMDVSCFMMHSESIASTHCPRSLRRRNRHSFSMLCCSIMLRSGCTYWAKSTDASWCPQMWTSCLKRWVKQKPSSTSKLKVLWTLLDFPDHCFNLCGSRHTS